MIRQTPNAGSQLPAGSTVSIVVSKGEAKATVPNVIGKLRADAVEALRAEGLTADGERTGNRSAFAGRPRHRPVPAAGLGSEAGLGRSTVVVGKQASAAAEPEAGEEE